MSDKTNRSEQLMVSETRDLVLPKSQAACVVALRSGKSTVTEIAMAAGLSVKKAAGALPVLAVLGLAERGPGKAWRATSLGETCPLSVEEGTEARRADDVVSPNGRRLLNLLERPKQGRTLAKELGVTLQGVLHILRKLFVQGHVKFGDPKTLSWWVMRAEDETSLLSREEEVVLSAIPGAYATDVLKIAHRARLAEDRVETVLERLAASGFVEPAGEFNGAALFRATAAGLGHPQKRPNIPDAEPPRLPVYSKRVRAVLASIENAGALRIKDVRDRMGLAKKSTNALMQYLKRRGLVEKTGENFEDPYALTVMGRLTLAEMTHPGQMQFGYSPVAVDTAVAARRAKPAGVSRPPRASKVPAVKPPPLGPHSDRVQAVLSVISNAGALRIKDVSDRLRLPAQSTNALMQYLKRKGLVQKAGEQPGAPYGLTTMGRDKLTDLTQRCAA